MNKKHLVISTIGDPFLASTWSGTPHNIAKALTEIGIEISGIDASIKSQNVNRLYRVFNRIWGYGAEDQSIAPLNRFHSARITQDKIASLGITKILHIGIRDLPLFKIDEKVDHYLFIDSTWDTWIKDSSIPYRKKLIPVAEGLEKQSFSQVKHIFTTAGYVKDNLIDHYKISPSKISIVGTGRGNIKPYIGIKDYQSGIILFVAKGRFEDKGGFLLIEAFKLAQFVNPNIKLVMVCPEGYIKMIKPVSNLSLLSSVSWDQLQQLFNKALLFAMPALNEPWGLVYLEALACKVPILGLDRNSIPEITQNGRVGFLAKSPKAEDISEMILKAFSNTEELEKMGLEAQSFCLENFSWEKVGEKIIMVIFND